MKNILFILIVIFATTTSYANVKRICNVRYKTEQGWSKYYTMEVQFVTGVELIKMTDDYKYSIYFNYCLLWFEEGGVAILEIDDILLVGDAFDRKDFVEAFQFRTELHCKQINGESKRKWEVVAKEGLNFFDPREKDD